MATPQYLAHTPPAHSIPTMTPASTMRTVTMSLLTQTPFAPSQTVQVWAASQSLSTPLHSSLLIPTAFATTTTAASAAATAPPLEQGFDMGSLPWPPLWLTIFAFALTLVATVAGVGAWLISSPPRYDDCICGDDREGKDGEERAEAWRERKEGEYESDDEDEDEDGGYEDGGAVELKRLLSDAPASAPQLNMDGKRQCADAANKRNFHNLRLDLTTAAAGLGVASWGRGDAGYACVNGDDGDDVWERKCRDYGIRSHGGDDEMASLVSLSLASCSSPSFSSASSPLARPNHNTTASYNRRSAVSASTKPVFSQPLRGWRKAVDDRVGMLACWIEAYVADGGRERDLLCEVTREERGDVVYGFEY